MDCNGELESVTRPLPFPRLFIGVDHIPHNGVHATVSDLHGLRDGDSTNDNKMVWQRTMDDVVTWR